MSSFSHSAGELIMIWYSSSVFSNAKKLSSLIPLKICLDTSPEIPQVTEQNMLLNTALVHQKDLCKKIVVALHEKWGAALFSVSDISGRGYDNSCPHSAIWWKSIVPKNHWHLSMKSQHVEILKLELSLECSRNSSLVSEGRSSTVLCFGHREKSSFHASQQRLHSLVVTRAKRDSGVWFRSQLCH